MGLRDLTYLIIEPRTFRARGENELEHVFTLEKKEFGLIEISYRNGFWVLLGEVGINVENLP